MNYQTITLFWVAVAIIGVIIIFVRQIRAEKKKARIERQYNEIKNYIKANTFDLVAFIDDLGKGYRCKLGQPKPSEDLERMREQQFEAFRKVQEQKAFIKEQEERLKEEGFKFQPLSPADVTEPNYSILAKGFDALFAQPSDGNDELMTTIEIANKIGLYNGRILKEIDKILSEKGFMKVAAKRTINDTPRILWKVGLKYKKEVDYREQLLRDKIEFLENECNSNTKIINDLMATRQSLESRLGLVKGAMMVMLDLFDEISMLPSKAAIKTKSLNGRNIAIQNIELCKTDEPKPEGKRFEDGEIKFPKEPSLRRVK